MRSDRLSAQRGGDAEAETGQRRAEKLREYQPEHVDSPRAERHADADFVGALADRVRGHAVDAIAASSTAMTANAGRAGRR